MKKNSSDCCDCIHTTAREINGKTICDNCKKEIHYDGNIKESAMYCYDVAEAMLNESKKRNK